MYLLYVFAVLSAVTPGKGGFEVMVRLEMYCGWISTLGGVCVCVYVQLTEEDKEYIILLSFKTLKNELMSNKNKSIWTV